jgi:membrane associated rhomboid family serine protease
VQNKDADESCRSKFGYEDNETISSAHVKREDQLKALESYFSKLNPGEAQQLGSLPEKKKYKNGPSFINEGIESYRNISTEDYKDNLIFDEKGFLGIHDDDQASNFFLTNILAAINIAVLLFETASPVKDSENEYLSLPLIYGAKVNNLILSGEWWRLLTPMWLGPVFSLIGAWLVHQSQNKQVIDKEISESMFSQAVIAAALSFFLSIFGGIDNWAHLGATVSGLFFGYLTCPSIEWDNNTAKNGRKEALALVRRQADPCKSIAIFAVSILALGALAFAYGQLSAMDLE